MSEQQIQSVEDEQPQRQVNKAQIIAAGGTLLASGIFDAAMHGDPYVIGLGLLVAGCVGAITPSVQELFLGSQADEMVEATDVLIDQLGYRDNSDLPQDAISKLRRIFRIDNPDELRAQVAPGPKSERPTIGASRPGQAGQPTSIKVPGTFTLDAHIEAIRTLNRQGYVYLGMGSIDKVARLSLATMYHVFDVSNSGSGKSNRFRLAMMQLVDFCEVYYINPFANVVKPVSDGRGAEVWAPIYDRLANGTPIKEAADIKALLQALIAEREARVVLESRNDFTWMEKPVFLFVDELPEVHIRCKEAQEILDQIVRTGRQYNIFAWVASQSGAVKDIGQSEATQAQYKTLIYGGGDSRSASKVMKGPVSAEEEQTLHKHKKGLTMMLAEDLSDRQFVRNPLVTNEALFAYFGLSFDLAEWYRPMRPGSIHYRSGVAERLSSGQSGKPNDIQETRELPAPQLPPLQPIAQTAQPALLKEELLAAFLDGRIDSWEKFIALSKFLPDSDTTLAGKDNVKSLSSERVIRASQEQDAGVFPDTEKDALIAPVAPFPTLPDLTPALGKDDSRFSEEQEQDFLKRYAKLQHVQKCLDQMPNSKGGIGLGGRYYKYANWLAKQQAQK